MQNDIATDIVSLDVSMPIWEQFFLLAPMVLVGTVEPDGGQDFAPKHLVTPMSWDNYFGFVCTPRHGTYQNIERTGEFTVTYPRPSQILHTSLAASPRCGGEGSKPVLNAYETFPATQIDGQFVADGYIFFECRSFKVIDGFGINSLITGAIVAAHVHKDALRVSDADDQELLHNAPIFAYLHPWRFATIDSSNAFPLPKGMKR